MKFMSNDLSPQIVKAVFKCDEKYKQEFSSSSCSLTISVGQSSHESDKFLATINLVSKSFQRCFLNVCDSLQRHTISLEKGISIEKAHVLSKKMGDEWLERNRNVFGQLKVPYEIIRWDEWLLHPNYLESAEKIENLYQNSEFFKKHIQIAANLYLNRYKKRNDKDENFYVSMYNSSMRYLKEECAVMLLWVNAGYNFEIYPSLRNEALVATYEMLIGPYYSQVLKPLALKFKKRLNNKIIM